MRFRFWPCLAADSALLANLHECISSSRMVPGNKTCFQLTLAKGNTLKHCEKKPRKILRKMLGQFYTRKACTFPYQCTEKVQNFCTASVPDNRHTADSECTEYFCGMTGRARKSYKTLHWKILYIWRFTKMSRWKCLNDQKSRKQLKLSWPKIDGFLEFTIIIVIWNKNSGILGFSTTENFCLGKNRSFIYSHLVSAEHQRTSMGVSRVAVVRRCNPMSQIDFFFSRSRSSLQLG